MLVLLITVLSTILCFRRTSSLHRGDWTPLDSYLSVAILTGLAAFVGQASGLHGGSDLGVLLVLWSHGAVVAFYYLSESTAFGGTVPARYPITRAGAGSMAPTVRRRAILATVVIGLLALAGAFGLREVVSESAGEAFVSLTRREVRYFTSVEGISAAGLPVLLLFAPVGAGLAGVLAVERRRWLLGVVAAAALASTTPSRTLVLETAIAGILMYLYSRGWGSGMHVGDEPRRRTGAAAETARGRRWGRPVAAVLIAVSIFFYFTGEGRALGKSSAPLGTESFLPEAAQMPLIYLGGSILALDAVMDSGLMPVERGTGRTAWIFLRLSAGLGMGPAPPETVAGYVDIPVPFNNYGWTGDAYFDGGILLVTLWGATLGLLGYWSHYRARRRNSLVACWVATVVHLQLIASFNALKLLWLPSVVAILVGGVTFWWIDNHLRSQRQTSVRRSAL